MKGNLRVGAAKRCINPTDDMFPFPPFWGTSLEGIYADMFVKALVIDNGEKKVLMVVYDCANGDYAFREEIAAKYGMEPEDIFCISIHNHGCPMLGGGPNVQVDLTHDPRERYKALIREEAVKVIDEAMQAMKPAYYGYGEGKSYINVNRDLQLEDGSWSQTANYEGFSDKTLAVMKFVDEEGKLIAAFLNHPTHANTTFLGRDEDGKAKTCADFVGFTCEMLEKRYGNDCVIFWSSGAAGNQNAVQCFRGDAHYTGEEDINYSAPAGLSYKYAQWLGEYHAVDAARVINRIVCDTRSCAIRTASTTIEFDGQTMPEGTSRMITTLTAQNSPKIMELLFPERVKDGRIIDKHLPDPIPTDRTVPCEMQLMILGDTAIVTAAAELYNEIGWKLKQESPFKNTFVITNMGSKGKGAGYIQDDGSKDHLTFQHYGDVRPGRSDEILCEGMQEMFKKVM